MIKKWHILFLWIFLGLSLALFAQIEITDEVRAKLEEKIEKYKIQKLAECKREAILEAEIYIDSIIHRSMNSPMHDTINIPAKPFAPTDTIQMEIDTSPVRPLLNETSDSISDFPAKLDGSSR